MVCTRKRWRLKRAKKTSGVSAGIVGADLKSRKPIERAACLLGAPKRRITGSARNIESPTKSREIAAA